MSHSWHDITPGEHLPKEFNSVIEIPLESSVKYELGKKTELICMDRLLDSPLIFQRITDSFPRLWPKMTIRWMFSSPPTGPSLR